MFDELSNLELEIAIAKTLAWTNIRIGPRGKLIGDVCNMTTLLPPEIPNWTEDSKSARCLEDVFKAWGVHDKFLRHLAEIVADASAATPRQICEAAFATMQSDKDLWKRNF